MARRDTIAREAWRVQVVLTDQKGSRVTHESNFRDAERARAYYETVHVLGHEKFLQVRLAGSSRFGVVRCEHMRTEEVA